LLVAVFAYEHCSEVVRHVLGPRVPCRQSGNLSGKRAEEPSIP
jgi:hypothetical protein